MYQKEADQLDTLVEITTVQRKHFGLVIFMQFSNVSKTF